MKDFPWWSLIAVAVSSLSFVLSKTMVFNSYMIKAKTTNEKLKRYGWYQNIMLFSVFAMAVTTIIAMYCVWNYLTTTHG